VRKAREKGERVPPRYVVAIMSGALEGLHSAHEAKSEKGQPLGLVHRDVSPQNVHVGGDGVPRLLDFGIAKATNRVQETRTDQIKGKVAYMSPEQLAKGNVDRRADVYAASVVLWEALTGERLFKADDVPSLVYAIINEDIVPPSSVAPDLPPGLDEVVMKGLAREADERWSSAREMAAALEAVLAPAPAREIGEWVHAIAGDALDWRQELVHRIESETSSSLPPPMRLDSPASPIEVSSGVVATEEDARDQAPTISNEDHHDDARPIAQLGARPPALSVDEPGSLEDFDDRAHHDQHARPRVGLAVMVVFGLLLVGGGVLFGMRWIQTSADPVEAAPAASTPAEAESAIVIGAQRNAPGGARTASTASAATAATAASAATATSGGVSTTPGTATTAVIPATSARGIRPGGTTPPHDECENPFTVDARGIRHPKPQCFKQKYERL
jgi:serine/threonine-protein kinase